MSQFYSTLLYKKLPVLLQNTLVTAKGISYTILKRGKIFNELQKELLENEKLNHKELYDLQYLKLRKLIENAYKFIPYYKKLFNKIGFQPDHLENINELKKLPLIDKKIVRQNLNDFLTPNVNPRFLFKGSTSGSTGTPLTLYMDRKVIESEYAFIWRQYRWAGCSLNEKIAIFRGDMIVPAEQKEPPYWRSDYYNNKRLYSSYHLSERTIESYLLDLQKFDPTLIYTYPSSLFIIAKQLKKSGSKLSIPSLKSIITSSETLYEDQREILEETFGVRIFDWYGLFERIIFIGTCEFGTYHIFPDYGITEFLPVLEKDGQTYYELVGTGFINKVMPLIRYRTGDLVTLSDKHCECGRSFPCIGSILGRIDEMITTPEGYVISRLDHIFKGIKNICLAQIYQECKDEIIIFVVPESNYSAFDENNIINNAKIRLGNTINIKIKKVYDIPRTSSGKIRGVISNLNKVENSDNKNMQL